jgi:hypothetical protein
MGEGDLFNEEKVQPALVIFSLTRYRWLNRAAVGQGAPRRGGRIPVN